MDRYCQQGNAFWWSRIVHTLAMKLGPFFPGATACVALPGMSNRCLVCGIVVSPGAGGGGRWLTWGVERDTVERARDTGHPHFDSHHVMMLFQRLPPRATTKLTKYATFTFQEKTYCSPEQFAASSENLRHGHTRDVHGHVIASLSCLGARTRRRTRHCVARHNAHIDLGVSYSDNAYMENKRLLIQCR